MSEEPGDEDGRAYTYLAAEHRSSICHGECRLVCGLVQPERPRGALGDGGRVALLPSQDEGKLRGRRESLDLRHMQSTVTERGIAQPEPKFESGSDILLWVKKDKNYLSAEEGGGGALTASKCL